MDLMHSTPKKTLQKIQKCESRFLAKVKGNQKELQRLVKEIEEVSAIDTHCSSKIKQSGKVIQRDCFVYNNCTYSWQGVFICSVIRVDKSVDGKYLATDYYISNSIMDAEAFLKNILQEWKVETMHFYKDTALQEDRCKTHKGAFALSVLRSIVINILHLNKVNNIGRKISQTSFDLTEALTLLSMNRLRYGLLK